MDFAAIIVAAGSGRRFGGAPKQWRALRGKALAAWPVEAFAGAGARRIVVVVAAGDEAAAKAALDGGPACDIVTGGAERADSVRAGLAFLKADAPDAVLIHDAARPFAGERHVRALLDALETADGAAPLLPVSDTLKRDGAGGYSTVDRAGLHRAQTPQAFRFGAIAAAYDALPLGAAPTDDAGVLEAAAGAWAAVDGDPMLMKITYAEDWRMAEALAGAARRTRVGMGYDVHRFGPGDSVWLCGVQIPHSQGVIGHSDADVGLHALTDALLGAIGAGDIGEHFPPSDPQWSGAASSLFVRHAVELAAQRGGRIANADITLICEAPRVGPHRAAMRETVAGLLGLNVEAVSVKATTTEGLGFTGRGEGLAAQAVVSVEVPA